MALLLFIEFIGHTKADGAEQSHKPVSVGLTEAGELENFETAIRRPYFHVRPFNSVELENWTSYLDFIEREGDLSKRAGDSPFYCLSGVGIYLVLKLPINLHILNSHRSLHIGHNNNKCANMGGNNI
ncbi:hypothetical protein DVH24_027122 [Malus domestica]|uniref:Uncharacterized protein n=1 Tax=Malus domestica TaxID=3750 RepID=A0A498ISG2_MALDO|nr:hypothetical protein DVH24_027122 [Malus domestica]